MHSIIAYVRLYARVFQIAYFSSVILLSIYFAYVTSLYTSNAASSPLSIVPLADTHVQSDSPSSNFGTRATLEVDGSPIKIIYMKFDLASLTETTVTTAKLRFKVFDTSRSSQNVKQMADTGWSETLITYNTRPSRGSTIATIPGGTAGSFVEVDVTTAVQGKTGQIISLGIDSTGSDGLDFYSREATADKPTLVIDTSTPTPTIISTLDPVIAAAGDIACGSSTSTSYPCKQKATSDLLVQMNPTAVLALGDLQYDSGSYSDFQNYYHPSWGRVKDKTHPALGNHEGNSGAGYFDYFNGVGITTGPAGTRGKGYYSFATGSWHIIALNSNCTQSGGCATGSIQEQWLRTDLAAHQTQCTLAFWHHPRFSSGHDGSPTTYSPFWQALYDYNADIVLVGHSHDYERFAPQATNGTADTVRGIREFVVGTGGRDFTGWSTSAPNSEIRQNTTFGVLKIVLHSTSYDWQFVPIAGSTFTDSGTTQCH